MVDMLLPWELKIHRTSPQTSVFFAIFHLYSQVHFTSILNVNLFFFIIREINVPITHPHEINLTTSAAGLVPLQFLSDSSPRYCLAPALQPSNRNYVTYLSTPVFVAEACLCCVGTLTAAASSCNTSRRVGSADCGATTNRAHAPASTDTIGAGRRCRLSKKR